MTLCIVIPKIMNSCYGCQVDCNGIVKLTNISCRKLIVVPRDVATTSGLLRYTHLSPEVLSHPPAAYTPSAEMYSLGIAMYEMWSGEHAYWKEITAFNCEGPTIDSMDKFVSFLEAHRPGLDRFVVGKLIRRCHFRRMGTTGAGAYGVI